MESTSIFGGNLYGCLDIATKLNTEKAGCAHVLCSYVDLLCVLSHSRITKKMVVPS